MSQFGKSGRPGTKEGYVTGSLELFSAILLGIMTRKLCESHGAECVQCLLTRVIIYEQQPIMVSPVST